MIPDSKVPPEQKVQVGWAPKELEYGAVRILFSSTGHGANDLRMSVKTARILRDQITELIGGGERG